MRFKIGDKVKVVRLTPDALKDKKHLLNQVFIVENIYNNVICCKNKSANADFYESELENISQISIAHLENGDIVETRNGHKLLVYFGELLHNECAPLNLRDFSDDLSYPYNKLIDIVNVYRFVGSNPKNMFDPKYLRIVWQRTEPKAKPSVKLSKKQLEAIIGCNIEIID